MLTNEDLILIRDELQLTIISFKEFIANCKKHGGTVPPWVQSRYNSFSLTLSHVNSLLGGD